VNCPGVATLIFQGSGGLFVVVLPQNFPGGGVHKVDLFADEAGHSFIAVFIVRGFLSDVALNAETGIGTAINESSSHVGSMASVATCFICGGSIGDIGLTRPAGFPDERD